MNRLLLKREKNYQDPGLFKAHANSPDLNQGPSDLQSDALTTKLSRQQVGKYKRETIINRAIYSDTSSFVIAFP